MTPLSICPTGWGPVHVVVCKTQHPGLSYHRAEEPARVVNEAGVGVRVTVSRGLATTMSHGADPVVLDVDDQGADVVVLQVPQTAELLQCMRILQARGVAVVVEMEDVRAVVPAAGGRGAGGRGTARRAADCAREADLVTVRTAALRDEHARHGRGAVVPDSIPRRVAELPPAYERTPTVTEIGWTGDVESHPHDLQVMGSGLEQALAATAGRSRFTVLGRTHDLQQRLGLTADPREVSSPLDVDRHLQAVGELFDIGVAPLRTDASATATSWLTVLGYAARGVYAVHSPGAEYERLGLGWRAKAPRDWAKALSTAVRDADWRREQAAAARAVVLDRHLTEHTVPLWLDAWQRAAENRVTALRRGAVAVG